MKNKFMLISTLLIFSLTACSSGKKEKGKTTNEQKVESSDKKPEKPSKEIEPENLLTKEEVESITGLAVERVKKTTTGSGRTKNCRISFGKKQIIANFNESYVSRQD